MSTLPKCACRSRAAAGPSANSASFSVLHGRKPQAKAPEQLISKLNPHKTLNRMNLQVLKLGPAKYKSTFKLPDPAVIQALLIVCWRPGIKCSTRRSFWHRRP